MDQTTAGNPALRTIAAQVPPPIPPTVGSKFLNSFILSFSKITDE
ncbi:MAG: hypothetical protein WBI45_05065 [Defluviitoga tunisiensis]